MDACVCCTCVCVCCTCVCAYKKNAELKLITCKKPDVFLQFGNGLLYGTRDESLSTCLFDLVDLIYSAKRYLDSS